MLCNSRRSFTAFISRVRTIVPSYYHIGQ